MGNHLSLKQILDCGVEEGVAAAMLPVIQEWMDNLDAIACWQQITHHLLTPRHPFALHQFLYTTTFANWDWEQGPPPAWIPSEEQIQVSNIATLMGQLGIASYPELHAWSVQYRGAFWECMIQRLEIRFRQPYKQILELSQGAELPRWLVGARFNIIESCFQADKDAPAILFQPEGGKLGRLSYGELLQLTNQVANGLVEAGLQAGDAIAIAMPMTAEAVAIYLGIVAMGGVVVSIADSFAATEIATRLRIGKATAIFTQDWIVRGGKQLPLYSKVVDAQAPRAIVLSADPSQPLLLRPGDLHWEEFLSPKADFDPVPALPEAHTNILFSSGTTGDPKAIPWTQTTPIKCAVDGHLHQDIHPGDVLAWPTNLGWMMGPWLIYASLINRATLALYYGAPNQREFGQFIQDAQVTLLGVVPSLVNHWKITDCMKGLDWSAIKVFSSTGECSSPQDMLFLMSLAGYKPIVEYCGGTEIGGAYITGTLVQPCSPSTFTTPTLGLDLVILDHNGQPATNGEVFLIPPSIGLSTELLNKDHHTVYFADTPPFSPTSSCTDAMKSALHTLRERVSPTSPSPRPLLRRHGDQMEHLPNGYYRAHGRVDDTMNLSGIKVSATEIERTLSTVEGISQVAAIAVAPPEGGPNQLVIYAVLAPEVKIGVDQMQATLQRAIATHLNPLFKIHTLTIVETLPRTESNKIMRRVLRAC
jgi:acetyl-CoA synthetase